MQKNFLILTYLLAILFFITCCKKYQEDNALKVSIDVPTKAAYKWCRK